MPAAVTPPPPDLGLLPRGVLRRAQAQGCGQEVFPIAARILQAVAGHELRSQNGLNTASCQADDPRRAPAGRSRESGRPGR